MVKITSLWEDIRACVSEYSPLELLGYYRVAQWFVRNNSKGYDKVYITITSGICDVVDDVFDVMRCMPDYRAVKMCDMLHREYCDKPLSTAEKIALADVSRTTYYAYLKEGEELFTKICVSILNDDKYTVASILSEEDRTSDVEKNN